MPVSAAVAARGGMSVFCATRGHRLGIKWLRGRFRRNQAITARPLGSGNVRGVFLKEGGGLFAGRRDGVGVGRRAGIAVGMAGGLLG